MREQIQAILNDAVREAKAPGAVAYVGERFETLFHGSAGFRQLEPEKLPAEKDTIYDVASLTKVVATTTAIMLLYEQNELSLDQTVQDFLPIPSFRELSIRDLLTHTTGLVSGLPYYKECTSLNEMLQRYAERGIDWTPGSRWRYSDVGFMILGAVVEMVAATPLSSFCAKNIFEPLEMTSTAFTPPKEWCARCAATEFCAWRKQMLVGVVHDENAYAIGGVSGHAGLFSTAEDLARFCRAVLSYKILAEKTVAEMLRFSQVPSYPWQGLGWLLDPWSSDSQGFLPSRSAFGHTGWTGTSIWVDRDRGLFAILLSNTCHPSRDVRDNRTLRQTFYQRLAKVLYPERTTVHTGLDRIMREDFKTVRDKKIAILTNHAAVDQQGRGVLDVLALEPSLEVRYVYSPEHGLQGKTEAGERVGEQPIAPTKDNKPPYALISLYGEKKQPDPSELEEIELLVIDLQDVGSRYYTYMATMKRCIEACSTAQKKILVLDRPNPIDGITIEGLMPEHTDADVCSAPIPMRHGCTMGELAMLFSKEAIKDKKLQLEVSLLDNWRRELQFEACGLPWISPSPNMATPQTALLYSGMCLFEGVNLNEGRGTDFPFEIIGSPWLNAPDVIHRITHEDSLGVKLEAMSYTPRAIPGRVSSPKYKDEICQGVRIHVEKREHVRAFRLAMALLCAVRQEHPNEFAWEKNFDVLAGGERLRQLVEAGSTPEAIVARCESDIALFRAKRVMLYSE